MAATRVPIDANHVAVWLFDDAGPTFVNSANPGTFDMTQVGLPVPQQASLFGPTTALLNTGLQGGRYGATAATGSNLGITGSQMSMEFWLYQRQYNSTFTHHWFMKQQTLNVWSGPFGEHGFENRNSGGLKDGQWVANIRCGGTVRSCVMDNYLGTLLYQWCHLGVSYDGSFVRAYLNGEQVGEASGSGTVSFGTGPWFVGAIPAGSGAVEEAYSSIADARVSNIGRSAAYFRNVYQQGMLNIGTGIQSKYYKLGAKYSNCNTRVVWVSQHLGFDNIPANPCGPGGTPEDLVVLESWKV